MSASRRLSQRVGAEPLEGSRRQLAERERRREGDRHQSPLQVLLRSDAHLALGSEPVLWALLQHQAWWRLARQVLHRREQESPPLPGSRGRPQQGSPGRVWAHRAARAGVDRQEAPARQANAPKVRGNVYDVGLGSSLVTIRVMHHRQWCRLHSELELLLGLGWVPSP